MQCWRPCPQSTGRQRLPLCNQLGTSSSHHHHHITIIIIVIIVIIIIMPLHWHDPRRKGQRWRSIGKSSRFIKQVALWIRKKDLNFPKLSFTLLSVAGSKAPDRLERDEQIWKLSNFTKQIVLWVTWVFYKMFFYGISPTQNHYSREILAFTYLELLLCAGNSSFHCKRMYLQ